MSPRLTFSAVWYFGQASCPTSEKPRAQRQPAENYLAAIAKRSRPGPIRKTLDHAKHTQANNVSSIQTEGVLDQTKLEGDQNHAVNGRTKAHNKLVLIRDHWSVTGVKVVPPILVSSFYNPCFPPETGVSDLNIVHVVEPGSDPLISPRDQSINGGSEGSTCQFHPTTQASHSETVSVANANPTKDTLAELYKRSPRLLQDIPELGSCNESGHMWSNNSDHSGANSRLSREDPCAVVSPTPKIPSPTRLTSREAVQRSGVIRNKRQKCRPAAGYKRMMINPRMDVQRIVSCLNEHGCRDITKDIDFSTMTSYAIRRGGSGQVYQAQRYDGSKVAIKALIQVVNNPGEIDYKTKKRAGREGYTWSKCRHPNILPLLGVAEYNNQVVLVSPWARHGALLDYISHHPDADRCGLASQVADGIAYMHKFGAVHGDIKGANVLVSDNGTAMLTDFGNAILKTYTLQFTPTNNNGWSVRWTAPEILNGDVSCSMEADVWALGMTILESITGTAPYDNLARDVAVVLRIVSRGLPLRPNKYIPPDNVIGDQIWSLLMSCWASEPSERPTATYVRDCLKDIVTHATPTLNI